MYMDIFGIDSGNLSKIDIHNFEKSRRNKNLKNVVFFVKNAGPSCLSANISST